MSVKKQTASKIGLVSAIMVIFGAVVGIGIFFKNKSVFDLNDGNTIGVLLSWIISIVLVLCMALSFAELSSCKLKNRNDGFGGWAQMFCGHKFGRYAKIGYSTIFYAVNTLCIVFFAGEACLNCFAKLGQNGSTPGEFNFGSNTTFYVFLIGLILFVLFMFLNYFSSKGMSKFGNIVGFAKFIPIIMVIFLGIIFGVLYNNSGIWNNNWIAKPGETKSSGDMSLLGLISSIPAILFAYEGYLAVGNIAGDMEKPEKNVPLAVVLGIAIISALYLAITIGCITAGAGNVYFIMGLIKEKAPIVAEVLTLLMSILIFVCIIGSVNAMCFSGMRALQASCEDGTIFKGKDLFNKKPGDKLFAGAIYFAILFCLWFLIVLIPSICFNTDKIGDCVSVVLVVYLYMLYGTVILGGFINRFTNKHEVTKIKVFPVAAIIGIIASYFVVIFCCFYQYLAYPITATGYKEPWGMFVKSGYKLTPNNVMIWFWAMFGLMSCYPLINDFLIKCFDRNNKQQLIWQ